jgi:hypothetical protein
MISTEEEELLSDEEGRQRIGTDRVQGLIAEDVVSWMCEAGHASQSEHELIKTNDVIVDDINDGDLLSDDHGKE